jgi:hypothetical protein
LIAAVDDRWDGTQESGFAALLDAVRAAAQSPSAPGIVVAAPDSAERVGSVISGLAAVARRRGLRVFVGRLEDSGQQTTVRKAGDVTTTVSSGQIQSWFDQVDGEHDLVLVHAPPLGSSLDAALLGKGCTGLVLVVEPLETTRSGLRSAVARAESTGCRVLGLVVSGGKPWIPRWLRRFLPDQVA